MPLEYDLSPELQEIVKKLRKRDPKRVEILWKKIKQVASCDEITIEHYKNLRYDQSDMLCCIIPLAFEPVGSVGCLLRGVGCRVAL